MGRLKDEPVQSERVQAARERAKAIIESQGIKPYSIEDEHRDTWPADDPNDDFLRELREWRSEGAGKK